MALVWVREVRIREVVYDTRVCIYVIYLLLNIYRNNSYWIIPIGIVVIGLYLIRYIYIVLSFVLIHDRQLKQHITEPFVLNNRFIGIPLQNIGVIDKMIIIGQWLGRCFDYQTIGQANSCGIIILIFVTI